MHRSSKTSRTGEDVRMFQGLVVRPSFGLRAFKSTMAWMGFLAAMFAALTFAVWTSQSFMKGNGVIEGIVSKIFIFSFIGWLIGWFYSLAGAMLRTACTRLSVRDGVLTLQQGILFRSATDMPLSALRTVVVEQGILDRLFGCGTLKFASSGTDTFEIWLSDVPNVTEVRNRIQASSIGHAAPDRQ